MRTRKDHWKDDPRKLRLMEWLTTPREERVPATQALLAQELGVHVRSLRDWHQRPDFRADWEQTAKDVVGTPERAQNVLDTLYKAATDKNNRSHVQAAKLYLEATNAIRPPQIEVKMTRPSELSDDELDAMLAQGAVQLAQERAQADSTVVVGPWGPPASPASSSMARPSPLALEEDEDGEDGTDDASD